MVVLVTAKITMSSGSYVTFFFRSLVSTEFLSVNLCSILWASSDRSLLAIGLRPADFLRVISEQFLLLFVFGLGHGIVTIAFYLGGKALFDTFE
jgi:hypothetical protein